MWILYEFLYLLGYVLYVPMAVWRRRLPHRGWSMRLGRYPATLRQTLAGRQSLWVHAVSVGEVMAARPLLQALARAYPRAPIVLSTMTAGGYRVAAKHVDGLAAAICFPLDLGGCVDRALNALQPKALILMESELWPRVIERAKARGIPVAVVNGRMSAGAFRRSRRVQRWLAPTLAGVDVYLMQTAEDAERVMSLGAPRDRVQVGGSLKWDASVAGQPDREAIARLRGELQLMQDHPVLVAASTHRGEEAVLLDVLRSLRASHSSLRLIVAPRHLERLGEVEILVRRAGYRAMRASSPSGEAWDVAVVDTFGQLPRYLALASVVFIGGSLIRHGGQNPLEAAALGKAAVCGPSMDNFPAIMPPLRAQQAIVQLATPQELLPALQGLLGDPARATEMGLRAKAVVERSRGVADRTLAALRPLLD